MLRLLNTKEDLLPGAILYLRVYFLGMPALALYNFGNAVFSSIGDTKDVYKRQEQPQLHLLSAAGEQALEKKVAEKAARKLPALSEDAQHSLTAVSYTHLDVYKRPP